MAVLVLFLTVLSSVFGINFNLGGQTLNIGSLATCGRWSFHRRVHFAAAVKVDGEMVDRRQVISQPSNAMESWLVAAVQRHAEKAGIGMPEVAIFEGELNAFATACVQEQRS